MPLKLMNLPSKHKRVNVADQHLAAVSKQVSSKWSSGIDDGSRDVNPSVAWADPSAAWPTGRRAAATANVAKRRHPAPKDQTTGDVTANVSSGVL
uniref:Uncharacterized protein n=1 Tax=Romanomermis culicivorax TaxID=13658 RepID=A0A915KYX8_ROMCU